MKIETIGKFEIHQSDGHGRSCGTKGNYSKKTTGIQVREPLSRGAYLLKKSYTFNINSSEDKAKAISKAKSYIEQLSKK